MSSKNCSQSSPSFSTSATTAMRELLFSAVYVSAGSMLSSSMSRLLVDDSAEGEMMKMRSTFPSACSCFMRKYQAYVFPDPRVPHNMTRAGRRMLLGFVGISLSGMSLGILADPQPIFLVLTMG